MTATTSASPDLASDPASELATLLRSARSRVLLRDITVRERVALDIASNPGDRARKIKWRDRARWAELDARLNRDTGAHLARIGIPGASRLAYEDAREHARYASDIRSVLRLFPGVDLL